MPGSAAAAPLFGPSSRAGNGTTLIHPLQLGGQAVWCWFTALQGVGVLLAPSRSSRSCADQRVTSTGSVAREHIAAGEFLRPCTACQRVHPQGLLALQQPTECNTDHKPHASVSCHTIIVVTASNPAGAVTRSCNMQHPGTIH